MKAEVPDSKPSRAVSSVEVEMLVAAAGELASLPITSSALSVGPCGRATVWGPERIWPPAESISALTHTVKPSYLLAWTWIVSGFPSDPSFSASLIIWSQVLGALLTRSLRYQRSSVFELKGAP